MSKLISRVASTILVATTWFVVTGCDQGVPLGTVEGRVTKDGQPQPNMWVHFQPQSGRPGEGRTGSDGSFALVYSQDKAGALVGRHTVRVYSGGETDSRDNQLSPRVEVLTKEVDVVDGENSFEFEIE